MSSETDSSAPTVGDDLVQAALRAARTLGKDVADVPVIAIAREAGVSRSTLIRRLGGYRATLDEAVRAAGVDPGGRPPVRTRALDAAADLVSTSGLAAATLEAIAGRTPCSIHSLYIAFGSRDELLRAVFERHSPLIDLEDFFATTPDDLSTTVHRLYRVIADRLKSGLRLVPALLAEALARPDSPAVQNLLIQNAPRMLNTLGGWLSEQIDAGQVRDLPVPLLLQQLVAPLVTHMLVRSAMAQLPGVESPDIDASCDFFAEAFLRSAAASR